MSARAGATAHDSWKLRKLRADDLIARHPHAEQILVFYINLLELQQPLAQETMTAGWMAHVRVETDSLPHLRLDRLPVDDLLPRLRRLTRDVTAFGTDTVNTVAEALLAGNPEIHVRLLQCYLVGSAVDDVAVTLGCEPRQLLFFPRALLQPIAETLAHAVRAESATTRSRTCLACGRRPQVAVIRDEPEIKGRRLLICSLCGSGWPFPRAVCPNCGEREPEKLVYHASDTLPHLRVEECLACRTYLKAVDLRQDGKAVPVVDEIASIELDVWADERGLEKLEHNVLGL